MKRFIRILLKPLMNQYGQVGPIPFIAASAISALGSFFASREQRKGLEEAARLVQEGRTAAAEQLLSETAGLRGLGKEQISFFTNLLREPGGISQLEAQLSREDDPLFAFRSQRGTEAINRALRAKGIAGAGAGFGAIGRFQEGLGAQFAERAGQRAFQRLGLRERFVGRGFGAVTQAANIRAGLASTLAKLATQRGAAGAGGIVGAAGGTLTALQEALEAGLFQPPPPVLQEGIPGAPVPTTSNLALG